VSEVHKESIMTISLKYQHRLALKNVFGVLLAWGGVCFLVYAVRPASLPVFLVAGALFVLGGAVLGLRGREGGFDFSRSGPVEPQFKRFEPYKEPYWYNGEYVDNIMSHVGIKDDWDRREDW
jgi:hypothetical protein